jgi:hypothetical protein
MIATKTELTMKHIKHKKLMMKAILLAGSCMLIALYSAGCEGNYTQKAIMPHVEAMGDFFPPPGEVRDVDRIERVQAASGARADATLFPAHFDKGELNSLGRQKLSLMIDDDDSNNPLIVYLDVPADDQFKAARQDSVIAYLKDQGLEEQQISFREGPNPATNHPAQGDIDRLAKTETGGAGGGATGGEAPAAGGDQASAGAGSTGMSGK